MPYSSAVQATRSMNARNAQKLSVFALTDTDQWVSSTPLRSPT
jgi:hypothetical protein